MTTAVAQPVRPEAVRKVRELFSELFELWNSRDDRTVGGGRDVSLPPTGQGGSVLDGLETVSFRPKIGSRIVSELDSQSSQKQGGSRFVNPRRGRVSEPRIARPISRTMHVTEITKGQSLMTNANQPCSARKAIYDATYEARRKAGELPSKLRTLAHWERRNREREADADRLRQRMTQEPVTLPVPVVTRDIDVGAAMRELEALGSRDEAAELETLRLTLADDAAAEREHQQRDRERAERARLLSRMAPAADPDVDALRRLLGLGAL